MIEGKLVVCGIMEVEEVFFKKEKRLIGLNVVERLNRRRRVECLFKLVIWRLVMIFIRVVFWIGGGRIGVG